MVRWKRLAGGAAAAAAVTTAAVEIVRTDGAPADASRVLDPAYIAANICSGRTPQRAGFFGLPIRVSVAQVLAKEAAGTIDQPLWDNLGTHGFKITTAKEQAQQYFNQGLRLYYAFNHAEAGRAFRKAQQIDPFCAMCYWGEALVLGPNINAPMFDDAVGPAFAAIAKANMLADRTTERERALIDALSKRYSPDPDSIRPSLDRAYARALYGVVRAYPDDLDAAALYAEALMILQPWDYWEADGKTPKGKAAEIVAVLKHILKRDPNQVAANHLYIHMVEASTTPERALPNARRLAALMPGAGHIVHMPSHIYYRLGMWRESLAANKAATRADEALFVQIQAGGIYPDAYYPHNVHFVVTSAQMAGDAETAIDYAERLSGIVTEEGMRTVPWVQPIKVAPYFAHVQFSAPDTILGLTDPGPAFPFVKAMWRYARGVAFARKGDLEAARAESDEIERLARSSDFSFLTAAGIPAPDLLALARHVVEARIAQAGGDQNAAIAQLERAVEIADSLAYMEPPYWYFPVRQALGGALLKAGRTESAVQVFRESLVRLPNNGWALWGLMRAYEKQGDKAAAVETRRLFRNAWAGDEDWLTLERL